MAFVAAGAIAPYSGASNIALNNATSGNSDPITYIQQFTARSTLVGMASWTFTVGYIGISGINPYVMMNTQPPIPV